MKMNEDKLFIYSTLMTIRKFEEQEHVKESMKEIIKFCCNYYQIKKGYKDKYEMWIENPEFILLRLWIAEKTGYEYDYKSKSYSRTIFYKAYKRFDSEEEVEI